MLQRYYFESGRKASPGVDDGLATDCRSNWEAAGMHPRKAAFSQMRRDVPRGTFRGFSGRASQRNRRVGWEAERERGSEGAGSGNPGKQARHL